MKNTFVVALKLFSNGRYSKLNNSLKFLILFFVMTLSLLLNSKGVMAATITVCPSGCNYTSIQSAINNANSGDTIDVYNGIYYENVIVNKTINLVGQNKDTTTIDGGGSGNTVYITSDWVNISGFTINGSGITGYDAGISINSNYNNISNINITDNYLGVYLSESNNITISYNSISGNGLDCILSEDSFYNTISENNLTGNDYGIEMYTSNYNTIYNNIISNNDGDGIYFEESFFNTISTNNIELNFDSGIILETSSNSNTISENIISKNYRGIDIFDSSSNTISGNNITGSNESGTYLSGSSNNTISENTLSGNKGEGIYFDGSSSNNNVSGNDISLGDTGIYIESAGITVHYNKIYDNNNYGINNINVETVNATLNYWGNAYGPYNTISNPDGQGNNISDNVTFWPYYYDEERTVLSAENHVFLNDSTTVGSNHTEVIVPPNNTAANITVLVNVVNVTLNLALLDNSSNITTNATLTGSINISSNRTIGTVKVFIPADLTITASTSWNCIINLPIIMENSSVNVTPDAGKTATVSFVIETGYFDERLTLGKAVSILIPGEAGKYAGYLRSGTFYPITTICSNDTQSAGNELGNEGNCKIDSGPNLVIWTKHFTKFITYAQFDITTTTTTTTTTTLGGFGGGSVHYHKETKIWDKITPGRVVIMKITDKEICFKQIQVSVNNQVNNVKITVTKLAGKPASVVHEVSGKVYKYMEINTQNLEDDNIESAKIRFEINKAWINSNNIDKDTIVLNRYKNGWEKLKTRLVGQDSDYYTYEADTPGFSVFAVTGEVLSETEEPGEVEETPEKEIKEEKAEQPSPPENFGETQRLIFVGLLAFVIGFLTFWKLRPSK